MIARIAPAAMIFVPSRDGISHNPQEFTADEDLVAGANILLDVVQNLASKSLKMSHVIHTTAWAVLWMTLWRRAFHTNPECGFEKSIS